jgi:hypothetical protein
MLALTHSHRTPAGVRGPFLAGVALFHGPDSVVCCIYMISTLFTSLPVLLCLELDREVTINTKASQKVPYCFVNEVFQVQGPMESHVHI